MNKSVVTQIGFWQRHISLLGEHASVLQPRLDRWNFQQTLDWPTCRAQLLSSLVIMVMASKVWWTYKLVERECNQLWSLRRQPCGCPAFLANKLIVMMIVWLMIIMITRWVVDDYHDYQVGSQPASDGSLSSSSWSPRWPLQQGNVTRHHDDGIPAIKYYRYYYHSIAIILNCL